MKTVYLGKFVSKFLKSITEAGQSVDPEAVRIQQALTGGIARVIEQGNKDYSRKHINVKIPLRLEITPPNGGAPYQTISVWDLDPANESMLQVGKTIPVKIDVQNPKIIYPDVPWAIQPSVIEFNEDDMLG